MSEEQTKQPFADLGSALKSLRTKRRESMAEAAGAVEIDTERLSNFEIGADRPSEDILLLLISHFEIKEDEATKLWELAGYDAADTPGSNVVNDEAGGTKSQVVVMPADARVVYTDVVHVMVNNYGVVMNFMQNSGPNGQSMIVSRVGMSKEHANSVIDVLQRALAQAEPKALPAPEQSDRNN